MRHILVGREGVRKANEREEKRLIEERSAVEGSELGTERRYVQLVSAKTSTESPLLYQTIVHQLVYLFVSISTQAHRHPKPPKGSTCQTLTREGPLNQHPHETLPLCS